jgi:hypothetical protein
MRDPQRITKARAGELESDLLVAMHDDRPSNRARNRTLTALGLGSATIGVSTSTAAIASGKVVAASGWIAVGKWIALGVGCGALTVGLLREAPAPTHRAQEIVAGAPRSVQWAAPVATNTVAEAPEPAIQPLPEPASTAMAPVRVAPKAPVARDAKPDLSEEVAVLDLARKATLAQDPLRTLELLDAYHRRFPRGLLGPEATVLRIDALSASGRKDAAVALARAFLATSPTSPHAERLRAILSAASTSGAGL